MKSMGRLNFRSNHLTLLLNESRLRTCWFTQLAKTLIAVRRQTGIKLPDASLTRDGSASKIGPADHCEGSGSTSGQRNQWAPIWTSWGTRCNSLTYMQGTSGNQIYAHLYTCARACACVKVLEP